MNRIDKKFIELKKIKRSALIVFITAGDPSLKTTSNLVKKISESGADIIELGIPFSDPVADGPTIQAASVRALKNKVTIGAILNTVKNLRKVDTLTPIVFMTYFNILNAYGFKKFAQAAKKSGVDGVIVPDLPPEEGADIIKACKKYDIDTIFLASPTSTPERIKLISSKSKGFIYYVSLLGVTGQRRNLSESIKEKVGLIKRISKKPVAVGFGISTPEQVKFIAGFADGVIVGSAVVKIIEKNLKNPRLAEKVTLFVRALRKAVDR